METVIQKWGNSLGVRIPKDVVQKKSLTAGTRVVVSEVDDHIIIKTVPRTILSLENLLSHITPTNLHKETNWGESQGNEIW